MGPLQCLIFGFSNCRDAHTHFQSGYLPVRVTGAVGRIRVWRQGSYLLLFPLLPHLPCCPRWRERSKCSGSSCVDVLLEVTEQGRLSVTSNCRERETSLLTQIWLHCFSGSLTTSQPVGVLNYFCNELSFWNVTVHARKLEFTEACFSLPFFCFHKHTLTNAQGSVALDSLWSRMKILKSFNSFVPWRNVKVNPFPQITA